MKQTRIKCNNTVTVRGLLSTILTGILLLWGGSAPHADAASAAGSNETNSKIAGERSSYASALLPPVSFTDIAAGITGVRLSDIRWGDYDSDGDLDFVLLGLDINGNDLTKIYRNDGAGSFVDIGAGLTGVSDGTAAWGDFDNDGDLDLAVTGSFSTTVYENLGGGVFSSAYGLANLGFGSSIDWGDYDNDGDLDIIAMGRDADDNKFTFLYQYIEGVGFSNTSTSIINVEDGTVAWGDYDNDSDLDLIIAGRNSSDVAVTKLYKNTGGVFSETGQTFAGVIFGNVEWGDYDADGDLDLALTGRDENGNGNTKIYRNDGGTFTQLGAGLPQLGNGSHVAWGDMDNDGDLDLLLSGDNNDSTVRYFQVYENSSGTFTDMGAGLTAIAGGSFAVADYDNDGDLDILAAGLDPSGTEISKIYRNESGLVNAAPGAPGTLSSTPGQGAAILSWNAASDTETPSAGLSYNLRIGTATGTQDVISTHADLATGFRKIVKTGNAGLNNTWTIQGLDPGTYYWSVQAVDGAGKGSGFATEQSFTITAPPPALFSDILAAVPGVTSGEAVWGDYDQDEDLDVVLVGLDPSGNRTTMISRNDGSGTFVDIGAGLPGVERGSAAWGDYDNDGDLDLALSGDTGSGLITSIYRNDGGSFIDIGAGLRPMDRTSMEWGDYDSDGDPDLAVMGYDGSQQFLVIFKNTVNGFQELDLGQAGLIFGEVTWGDYDLDGDLDLAAIGLDASDVPQTLILQNQGPGTDTFTNVAGGLTGIWSGVADWGDYDNDGDLDLVVAGSSTGSGQTVNPISIIYRNDNGQFTDIGAGIADLASGGVSWGDMDNDGDLDLAISGFDSSGSVFTIIYENNNGSFIDSGYSLENLWDGRVDWGDFNGDNDLDFVINGQNSSGTKYTIVYENQLNPSTTLTPHKLIGFSPIQSSVVRSIEKIIVDFGSIIDPLSLADGVTVTGTVSGTDISLHNRFSNTGTTFNFQPSPGFYSSETVTVKVRTGINGVKNLYGQWFDGNSNGVSDGVPADELTFDFDVAPLGDLNFDLLVDFNDLPLLRDAWVNDDFTKEMGPVEGSFPTLRVVPDTLFDVEDLVTFIRYWNDAFPKASTQTISSGSNKQTSSQRARLLKSQARNELEYVDFVLKTPIDKYRNPEEEDETRWLDYDLMVTYPDPLLGMEVIIDYDADALRLRRLKDNKMYEQVDGGQTVFLSHVDSLNGVAVINTANFGSLGAIENRALASLRFERKQQVGDRSPGDFSIGYDIRDRNNTSEKAWSEFAADLGAEVPNQFALEQNYPNPFNPQTTIRYQVAETGTVQILVYNILGRKVATLLDREVEPGFYRMTWNAGRHLASGVYIYVLDIQSNSGRKFRDLKKMLLIK